MRDEWLWNKISVCLILAEPQEAQSFFLLDGATHDHYILRISVILCVSQCNYFSQSRGVSKLILNGLCGAWSLSSVSVRVILCGSPCNNKVNQCQFVKSASKKTIQIH